MRLRIVTTVLIDLATGEAQSKATWQVEGHEEGLGSALAQAAAALTRTTPPSPLPEVLAPSDSERVHPAAKEARILGGLLEIRNDVEQALTTRPAGRVLEVLKWIRQRRSTTQVRNMASLFWSLVNKD
jgi:hypothetical protein